MIDPVSLLVGGGLVTAGFLAGRIGRPKSQKPPRAMCDCHHPLAMHDPKTNQCHGTEKRDRWSKGGYHVGYDHVPCPCRQYTGPKPLESFLAPELLPPTE